MTVSISHQINEAEQWAREMQDAAAKPGKGQELARYRHEVSKAIATTLRWCRDNADELRAYRKSKGQADGMDN